MLNNETLSEKLTALAKGNGFIVFAIGDVYVQFSVEDDDTEMYIEAASHNYVHAVSADVQPDFAALSFAIEDGNYNKKINRSRVDQMVKETQQVFEDIYKVDYNTAFEVTENIGG